MKKVIIPAELMGEFQSFIVQPKVIPTVVDEFLQDTAVHQMEVQAEREWMAYKKNGECQARWWARKKDFGRWVAKKHGQKFSSLRQVQERKPSIYERDGETYTGAFSALKGGVK